jgi:hypothetical protein
MNSTVKMGAQIVKNLKVKWSHLAKPDLEYNSGHSVTVEMNDELKKLHKEMQAQTGVKHINGLSEYEGVETAKFSTKVYVNEGVEKFPSIYDTNGQKTMDIPFGGDVVNLVFKPREWDKPKKSISCYLQEVQLVEKNGGEKMSVTFAKVQDKSNEVTFSEQEEDLPF